MQAILDKAEELANLIHESPAYKSLRAAELRINGDAEAKDLVERYNARTAILAEKQQNLEPVEPEDKRELQDVIQKMQSNQLMQELLRAQTEYAMLMNRINEVLRENLERKTPEEEEQKV